MFCTTLRRRSSFVSVVPLLTSSSGLAIKESLLETHDIALPLPNYPKGTRDLNSTRTLRLLLLSPDNMSEARLPATLSRIQHFVALTGGLDLAIVMSLSTSRPFSSAKELLDAHQTHPLDGVRSYALLQAEFLERTDLPWIPILPLATLDGLVELVKTHAQSISRPKPKPSSAIGPLGMLAHSTLESPLPSLTVDLTCDLFSSLSHVAQAAIDHRTTPVYDSEGLASSDDALQSDQAKFDFLAEQLDKDAVESMIYFWREEYAVE